MANSPIGPNDTVYAIKACPKCNAGYGHVYIVKEVVGAVGEYECSECLTRVKADTTALVMRGHSGLGPISWYKKIPPLKELEAVKDAVDISSRK